jgi:hypothetical protein
MLKPIFFSTQIKVQDKFESHLVHQFHTKKPSHKNNLQTDWNEDIGRKSVDSLESL